MSLCRFVGGVLLIIVSVVQPLVQGSLLLRGVQNQGHNKKGKLEVDVYYVSKLLDKFKRFAVQGQAVSDYNHGKELEGIREAMLKVTDEDDKTLLEAGATENEESRLESTNAFNEMLNFVNTLKQAMGAKGSAPSCADLTCGEHAVCALTLDNGPECACEEGYEGDGFICRPPVHFTPHPLLDKFKKDSEGTRQVADIHMIVFQKTRVALVFRDISKGHQGFFMLGRAGIDEVGWNAPKIFSNGTKAYDPVIAGLPNGRVAIAYRDKDRGGMGFLLGGEINPRTNLMRLGTLTPFARNQAHEMAIVALPHTRVAVLYADRKVDANGKTTAIHGAATLAQIRKGGLPHVLGLPYRFAEGATTRIRATLLSPSSFVVAYRGESDEAKKTEASVVWGEMKGSELFFDSTKSIALDSDTTQIWGRDVSLVSANIFAYTYHCGGDQIVKQATIKVDPGTHAMTVVSGPIELAKGPMSWVQSVSLPYAPRAPHTFSFYQNSGRGYSQAAICPVMSTGQMRDCVDLNWAGVQVQSVAAQPLGEGRLLFVFTDMSGTAYYQYVGLFDDEE